MITISKSGRNGVCVCVKRDFLIFCKVPFDISSSIYEWMNRPHIGFPTCIFCSHNRFSTHRANECVCGAREWKKLGDFVCHESQQLSHIYWHRREFIIGTLVSDFSRKDFCDCVWVLEVEERLFSVFLHFRTFYNGSQYFILITVSHSVSQTIFYFSFSSFF
jgi:hypothetical protein